MAQKAKDAALSLLWLGSLLQPGSVPDLGTSACHRCRQIKKKKKSPRLAGPKTLNTLPRDMLLNRVRVVSKVSVTSAS